MDTVQRPTNRLFHIDFFDLSSTLRRLPGYFGILLLVMTSTLTNATELAPNTQYEPDEVVKIVVEALRTNDDSDSGIATVFRFASPGNKRNTGPLERFTGMIKKGFGDMLNHVGSEAEPLQIRDQKAIQPVWLTTSSGEEVGYLFQLGKQADGEFEGMWMTEAVYPIKPRGQSI